MSICLYCRGLLNYIQIAYNIFTSMKIYSLNFLFFHITQLIYCYFRTLLLEYRRNQVYQKYHKVLLSVLYDVGEALKIYPTSLMWSVNHRVPPANYPVGLGENKRKENKRKNYKSLLLEFGLFSPFFYLKKVQIVKNMLKNKYNKKLSFHFCIK